MKKYKSHEDWVVVAEYVAHKDPSRIWTVEAHKTSGHLRCHCPAFVFNPECGACWQRHGGFGTTEATRVRFPLEKNSVTGHRYCPTCNERPRPNGATQATCKHIRRYLKFPDEARSHVVTTDAFDVALVEAWTRRMGEVYSQRPLKDVPTICRAEWRAFVDDLRALQPATPSRLAATPTTPAARIGVRRIVLVDDD